MEIVYGDFSHLKTVFIDLFPVKKCVFAHASLETGNPCIEKYQPSFLDRFSLFFLRSYKMYYIAIDTISSKREPD